jgi:hypothetical protein
MQSKRSLANLGIFLTLEALLQETRCQHAGDAVKKLLGHQQGLNQGSLCQQYEWGNLVSTVMLVMSRLTWLLGSIFMCMLVSLQYPTYLFIGEFSI